MHGLQIGRHVGRVAGLWRYPVKSMAGEALEAVDVSWHGLAGDRRWAFIRDGMVQSGFPWLTLRERADLSHFHPSFVDPAQPDRSPVRVRTPDGDVFDVQDPVFATALYSSGTRPIKQDRGVFDTFPLSIISTHTIGRLSDSVGVPLDVQRFRPNILVDACDGKDFPEDGWLGCILRIGTFRLRIDKRDGRCVVITIDPQTTERNTAILRTVARDRQGCLGVYGSTVEPGRVAMNDAVLIESSA